MWFSLTVTIYPLFDNITIVHKRYAVNIPPRLCQCFGNAISTATPTFSTMHDLDVTVPTLADTGQIPVIKDVGHETGSEPNLRIVNVKRCNWSALRFVDARKRKGAKSNVNVLKH